MAMQDLLSQDETIDVLLHGVDDGLVETESDVEPGTIKSYDLDQPGPHRPGRMPTLEMINERFARYTRISMFNLLRRSADVAVGGVQVMKFGEYVHSLYVPTSLNLVKMARCAAPGCSFSTPSWCSSWWTTSRRPSRQDRRPRIHPTELRVVRAWSVEQAFVDLAEAWHAVMPITFEYVNPR